MDIEKKFEPYFKIITFWTKIKLQYFLTLFKKKNQNWKIQKNILGIETNPKFWFLPEFLSTFTPIFEWKGKAVSSIKLPELQFFFFLKKRKLSSQALKKRVWGQVGHLHLDWFHRGWRSLEDTHIYNLFSKK